MKLLSFLRLGFGFACRVYFIYIKRSLGFGTSSSEFCRLAYANKMIKTKHRHAGSFNGYYRVIVDGNTKLHLRKDSLSDFSVYEQIWIDGELQPIVEIIKHKYPPGRIRIADAGANIGLSTVYLQRHLAPQYEADVVAIEPEASNVAMIRENTGINNISCNIEQAGVYNKACYLQVTNDFRDKQKWSFRVEESAVPTSLRSVEILQLMKTYSWENIHFLKIDIEGSEKYIFDDERYAQRILECTGVIAVEPHVEYIQPDSIKKVLEQGGFGLSTAGEYIVGTKTT